MAARRFRPIGHAVARKRDWSQPVLDDAGAVVTVAVQLCCVRSCDQMRNTDVLTGRSAQVLHVYANAHVVRRFGEKGRKERQGLLPKMPRNGWRKGFPYEGTERSTLQFRAPTGIV